MKATPFPADVAPTENWLTEYALPLDSQAAGHRSDWNFFARAAKALLDMPGQRAQMRE
jgi:hypothetical protein